MLNFLASLILASLLIPSGFNFLTQKAVDYSYIEQTVEPNAPKRLINKSFGLKTTAKSILVIDDASGAVLYNKNSLAVLPIASLTKLMTALVILEAKPDWQQRVKITASDHQEGGITYLLTDEEVTVRDLFNLMLVASANEAAVALARTITPDNFVSLMNKKATELGLRETYFLEPSGVEPGNVSSPTDLIKLAQVALSQTEITQALLTKEYPFTVLNNQRQGRVFNNDKLVESFLNYNGYQIIGAKTGYLDEALYCLLLKVKKTDGPNLTLVILGAETIEDRWQEAKGLVDWVFRNYVWP